MTPTQGPPRTPLSNISRTPQPNAWSTSTCSRPQKSHSEDPPWMFASLDASLPRRHPDTCSPRLCQYLLRVALRTSTGDPPGEGRASCHLICWMNSTRCWARLAAAPRAMTDRKWGQEKEGYRERSVWTVKHPLMGRVEKERCGGWQTETTQCRWSQRRCFHDLSLRTALKVGYRKRCRRTRGCGKQVQGDPGGHADLSWTWRWPKHYKTRFIRRPSKPRECSENMFSCRISEVSRNACFVLFSSQSLRKGCLGYAWKELWLF